MGRNRAGGCSKAGRRNSGGLRMKTRDYREVLLVRLKDPEYAVGYLTDVIANESAD